MFEFKRSMKITIVAAAACACLAAPLAAGQCVRKGAVGDAGSKYDAMIQVDEALLQAVDWGAWAAWMSSNAKAGAAANLPGYSFGARSYKCNSSGSLGWTCHGSATICKR